MSEREFDAAVAQADYRPHYEMYDTSDGLAGMPVWLAFPNAAASPGKLWFVTTGGVTVIDPARQDVRPVLPKVRVDNVTANGRPVPLDGSVTLPADVRNVVFEYTVPSLTSPAKVTFRHRLSHVDADWIDTGSRRDVSYANLAPGPYTFDVMAVSSDHGWSESAASWTFAIQPMFYQTRWFYAVVGVALAMMSWLLWRLRVRQLRRQFSLVLGERARMSREIHDTLLQGMVGVALQFDMLSQTVSPSMPTLVDHLVKLRRQVEEYIRETREAIFDLRVPRSDRDIAELLREAGTRITAGTDVQFNVAVSGTSRPSGASVDRQLVQVAREAITNAVRHARPRRIQVKVDYRSDSILLRVSDDGQGFDVDRATRQPDGHFGLQTMRERAQQVGGRVRIKSAIGMGTDIEVAVPLAADI
jgi:signal transduction histidine kinase